MLKRYCSVLENQAQLLKQNTKEELLSPDKSPEKSAYQANLSEIQVLKKELFRVIAIIILILSVDQGTSCTSVHNCYVNCRLPTES